MATNGVDSDSNGLASLYAEAQSMAASPLLYIGAVTVVVGTEVAEWLPLGDLYSTLALFPVALALLYGQLTLLAYLRRRGYGGGC
ncbi:hypothetical protein C475_02984 [Halosimplex carlsbadense 2-9-1]|uniref:Uncharacterized protein n=1 Tax=Halosimplex carlsbadense 2-9-1 TaxID=797114 RepID=M0D385_9EURY|nr:hypothetical protein [Halosimplex carlsbadense]ELZ29147.1 hypothetical protein C475_02984 [Halosimplex carlsbadense 2-9-1]